jgi:hypothetical protein
MMSTIKNIRPGILVIPDAKLRLRPGQTVEVGQPTNQIERLIASGHLVRVGGAGEAGGASGAAKVEEAVEVASIAQAGPVGPTPPVTQAAPPSASTTSTQSTPSTSTAATAPTDKPSVESDKQRSVLEALTKKRQEVGGGAE